MSGGCLGINVVAACRHDEGRLVLPNVTRLRIPEHRELYLSAPPVAEPIGGIASGTTFTGDQVGLFRAQPARPEEPLSGQLQV